MNGHEGIGIVNLWTLGKYLCMYIAFSNFQFFMLVFLFCWFFPLYMYINMYRNIGCMPFANPVRVELKALDSVRTCGKPND